MAKRYWMAHWSMGYVGTDSVESVDLCGLFGYTEEEVAEMTDEDAEEYAREYALEQAQQKISAWAEPDKSKE